MLIWISRPRLPKCGRRSPSSSCSCILLPGLNPLPTSDTSASPTETSSDGSNILRFPRSPRPPSFQPDILLLLKILVLTMESLGILMLGLCFNRPLYIRMAHVYATYRHFGGNHIGGHPLKSNVSISHLGKYMNFFEICI